MNLIVIIILAIVLVLTLCLITLLLSLFHKHRKSVFNTFASDLNHSYRNSQLKTISPKDLPVAVATKDVIYFYHQAVLGNYDRAERVINEKNFNVTSLLKAQQWETFYHYKIINLGACKFVPLNKIDLLLTKNNLYLHHPLTPITLKLNQIKDLTIFWEKNPLVQKKAFFPGVAFKHQTNSYFFLFQTYKEVVKFLTALNLIYLV